MAEGTVITNTFFNYSRNVMFFNRNIKHFLLYYLYSVMYCAFSTYLSVLSLRHPITRVQWISLLSCSSRHSPWRKPTVSWL